MYEFSAPMPFSIEDINQMLDINKRVEKSQIKSLYGCVPRECEVFTGFEQARNFSSSNVSWDYWKSLIEHTLSKNSDFIYLLNSPRPIDASAPESLERVEKLDKLLNELRKIGVNKLRITSGQLMAYIGKNYADFRVLASTSLEYKTIWEYQNFIFSHPEVRQIVPSHDTNKNFMLLSSLKKRYPNIQIELMVNEGCLQGCPNRMIHASTNIDLPSNKEADKLLSSVYPILLCSTVRKKYPIQNLVIGNHIFPWEIEEYSKIGINNFKFVGRDEYAIQFGKFLTSYYMYLAGIDNIKNVENYPISDFVHHLYGDNFLKNLTVKEYKKYFPDIKYFKKNGHLCASVCGNKCRYCYKCAEKIQKKYSKTNNIFTLNKDI